MTGRGMGKRGILGRSTATSRLQCPSPTSSWRRRRWCEMDQHTWNDDLLKNYLYGNWTEPGIHGAIYNQARGTAPSLGDCRLPRLSGARLSWCEFAGWWYRLLLHSTPFLVRAFFFFFFLKWQNVFVNGALEQKLNLEVLKSEFKTDAQAVCYREYSFWLQL